MGSPLLPGAGRSSAPLTALRVRPGGCLLVSELSRLGRSLGQVIHIVDTLVHRKILFIAIKEGIEFDGRWVYIFNRRKAKKEIPGIMHLTNPCFPDMLEAWKTQDCLPHSIETKMRPVRSSRSNAGPMDRNVRTVAL